MLLRRAILLCRLRVYKQAFLLFVELIMEKNSLNALF